MSKLLWPLRSLKVICSICLFRQKAEPQPTEPIAQSPRHARSTQPLQAVDAASATLEMPARPVTSIGLTVPPSQTRSSRSRHARRSPQPTQHQPQGHNCREPRVRGLHRRRSALWCVRLDKRLLFNTGERKYALHSHKEWLAERQRPNAPQPAPAATPALSSRGSRALPAAA